MPHQIKNILSQDCVLLASTLELEASSARIEVQCLLQKTLQVPRVYLLAHPERSLTETEFAHYSELLQRRLKGEPVAYILGEREFFGLNLKVSPATLIPRPDTELLVELALQHIPSVQTASLSRPDGHPLWAEGPSLATLGTAPLARPASSGLVPPAGERLGEMVNKLHILDLGTGSGAIALAVAQTSPQAEVLACDASAAALAVAQENARALGISNVKFVQSDWYTALGNEQFNLIVSNPPYIAVNDPHLAQGDVRFEPVSALVSGVDGLDDIRHIVTYASSHLLPGGWLLLEHGYDQATAVRSILQEAGFVAVFSACDLSGIERVSGGQLDT